MKYLIFLFLSALASALRAEAPVPMLLSDLYPEVEQFIYNQLPPTPGAQVEVKIKALDERIKVNQCSQALEIFTPFGSGASFQRLTVGLRCSGTHPWTLYVPAQVTIMKEVLVAARHLNAREIVEASSLKPQIVNITTLDRGYFDTPEQIIGKVTRQPLRAGQVISTHHLSEPKIVMKGQLVNLQALKPQFAIQTQAKALSEGSLGQRIQVQNLSSKRIIEAVISAPGTVQIQ